MGEAVEADKANLTPATQLAKRAIETQYMDALKLCYVHQE
jgi:hypothetical protein